MSDKWIPASRDVFENGIKECKTRLKLMKKRELLFVERSTGISFNDLSRFIYGFLVPTNDELETLSIYFLPDSIQLQFNFEENEDQVEGGVNDQHY